MAGKEEKIRHLVVKIGSNGRRLFYWQPSASLRRLGFRCRRLPDDPALARREAERLNAEADRERAAAARRAPAGPRPGSVADLVARYLASSEYGELAESTKRDYARHLEWIRETFGEFDLAAITPKIVQELKESMADTPWQANVRLRVLRLLFGFGRRLGLCRSNPAEKFRQLRTPPRQTIWSHEQERRFIEACGRLERPSMALAVKLALWTAQREGDILRLRWEDWDGTNLRIRQSKTGTLVVIPLPAALAEELEALPRTTETIVTDERGRPWRPDTFRHVFRKIAREAGIGDVRFADLRRTAVVRLAEADCTTAQISAISGHDIDSCEKILEVYLPRTPAMAASAMEKRLRNEERAAGGPGPHRRARTRRSDARPLSAVAASQGVPARHGTSPESRSAPQTKTASTTVTRSSSRKGRDPTARSCRSDVRVPSAASAATMHSRESRQRAAPGVGAAARARAGRAPQASA